VQHSTLRQQLFQTRLAPKGYRTPMPLPAMQPLRQNCAKTVIGLERLGFLFERKQIPQLVDIRHFRMEQIERLEAGHIFRNQQVAGSTPAGGSI